MKKAISFVVCFFMVLSCLGGNIAFAAKEEPFSLRNGIMFGDSKADVKAKEKELSLDVDGDTYLKYIGNIVGSDGEAYYAFGEHDKLNSMRYEFESENSSEMTDLYKTIRDSCTRKYGDALDLDEGNVFTIRGTAIENAYNKVIVTNYMGGKADFEYEEWVVYGNDGNNVKIELAISYLAKSYGTYYDVDVSYNSFTQEELDAILNDKASTAIAKMNEADAAF